MFPRTRYRRTFSALPTAAEQRRPLRSVLIVLIGAFLVLWGGWRALQALGVLNQVQRMRVELSVTTSPVNVSIEGDELRRAEDAKLYAEDRVVSNTGGRAKLSFFDGTLAGIDEVSDITITASEQGTKRSTIALTLAQGKVLINVPSQASFSGSIQRTVTTELFEASFPASARAIVSTKGIQVLEADGLGVIVQVNDIDEPAYIGEGQQLELPAGSVTGSIYDYRSTLDPAAIRLATALGGASTAPSTPSGSGASIPAGSSDLLLVRSPAEGQQVTSSTVHVEGQAGPTVQRVRVNGYDTQLSIEDGSFTQELAVTRGATMDILVEALDARNIVIGQQHRTIRLTVEAMKAPAITSPAKEGSVYRTSKKKFDIKGTAPAGAAGIVVNDYRLMLFKEGDAQWTYLANADLGNLLPGANTFTVYAVDSAGNKGPTATITILFEEGQEGVVTGAAASVSSAPEIAESTLPQNPPLTPGILSVTAPTAGTSHTATTNDILIEGNTSATTDSVWVNGYKLKLYSPGKTFWNYYARESYGTLKKGKNTYVINARNAKGEILDTMTYEINY